MARYLGFHDETYRLGGRYYATGYREDITRSTHCLVVERGGC